ncbi:MAG: hypothetical protein ACYSWO_20870 [Planctomycetota bacterium]|jgi:hypothetical protein
MKHVFTVAALIPLLFAVGCGQKQRIRVTYRSDPPGGTLYKLDGKLWGPCPKVLYYDHDEEAIENGYLDVKGLMVRWPTGPDKVSDKLIRVTVDGTDRQVTFIQPPDEPQSATPRAASDEDQ